MSTIIGIDISKIHFDAHIDCGFDSRHRRFLNTYEGFRAFEKWAEAPQQTEWVCMEATGRYGLSLALYLTEAGYRVSLVNPLRIKAFSDSLLRRNKTDKSDAQIIAKFARVSDIPLWEPKSTAMDRLQQRTRHLQALQKMIQQERNRLQSGLTDPFVLQMIQDHINQLEEQLATLRTVIQQLIQSDEILQCRYDLLTTIPGIGVKSAPILIAEIGDITRFDNARQLAAYAGITPSQRESGSSVRGASRISKRGNSRLRRILYMPAIVAKQHNPHAQALTRRLEDRGKKPKEIIVAVAHQLLRLAYGVLKHGQPYNPHYLSNQPNSA